MENPPDTEHQSIRVSSLRMTPVDLPYVPILLNETFIIALWDTGSEKSFISEEVYRKYFSYRPRQKTKDKSNQLGLTHVLYHEIDTGDKGPYRYDRVKQGIIDYHINKRLQEGTIRPIQSPYVSPTVASRHEGSGQYKKVRETKTTKNGTNRAAEKRTVRSKQTTAVSPCPYYLRSRVRQTEGFPEERRNSGIASIPQNNIRRRSLSMEALDGDPMDRSE
ncbi:uncharacterized protein TNCV_1427451 [Trichonephila clavipes]|nr:uncharacterized protein TNCV_1427451 [Trichonephila clavipes]